MSAEVIENTGRRETPANRGSAGDEEPEPEGDENGKHSAAGMARTTGRILTQSYADEPLRGPWASLKSLKVPTRRRLVPYRTRSIAPGCESRTTPQTNRPEMAWILLIEDEARLAASVQRGLEEEGFTVDHAADAAEGRRLGLANAYDVFIVDWRLPRGDGKALVEDLRAKGRREPVLMLTALGDLDHRVAGLGAGADDYLAKPFAFEELVARIRALLRRPPLQQQDRHLSIGALVLDGERHRVTLDGPGGTFLLNLRPKEYALLELLLRRSGSVVSRTVIAERVWGDALYVSDNALDVTVSGLRQKLADAEREAQVEAPAVETVRGVGYRLAGRATADGAFSTEEA